MKNDAYSGRLCAEEPWVLVFEDDFNGDTVDTQKWDIYVGVPRDYGFRKQKAYHQTENVTVQNGILKITANREQKYNQQYWSPDGYTTADFDYTSGEIWSKQRFSFGKYEARIKIPKGKGLWPAFWLYGDGTNGEEIDIFEFWNEKGNRYRRRLLSRVMHMTVHYDFDDNNRVEYIGYKKKAKDFSNDFHIFTLIYTKAYIKWLVDGELVAQHNRYTDIDDKESLCELLPDTEYRCNKLYPFRPLHIVLNLAIQHGRPEGGYDDDPDSTTPFPSSLEVDWVRYYVSSAQE